ncbi:MAG: ferrochelatase [Candidatus Marinimicrobia bacterium]|nr:ferrochelatase [Candidatus Neomarinimicrobiota bacterium]
MDKNILLINLGSPKSLDKKDVKDYLREFLSDDLVIDLPKILQQFILRCFILPFRPAQAKEAYELIWEEEGSPLIINTQKIANALAKKTGWNIDIAMRYQEPSIENVIEKYKENNVEELTVISLYPHNAMSTTLSTELAVKEVVRRIYPDLKLSFVEPFYDNPLYIEALSESIKPYLKDIDKLVFSYHGIPMRHIKKSDISGSHCLGENSCCNIDNVSSRNCYRSNTFTTSKLTAQYLKLKSSEWMMTFQSRVSIISPNWLKPYTDIELDNLPPKGVERVGVVCPSFVADCLETLEEIDMRARETFEEAGGETFKYIPCLNDDKKFISVLEHLILDI